MKAFAPFKRALASRLKTAEFERSSSQAPRGPKFDLARLAELKQESTLPKGPYKGWRNLRSGGSVYKNDRRYLRNEEDLDILDNDGEEDIDEDMPEALSYEEDERRNRKKNQVFYRILRDLLELVNSSHGCSDVEDLLDQVEEFIDRCIRWDCRRNEMLCLKHSFGHTENRPMVDSGLFDPGTMPFGDFQQIAWALELLLSLNDPGSAPRPSPIGPKLPPPFSQSFRRHPLSSPLCRFKADVDVTPTPEDAAAAAIYDARCEILGSPSLAPVHMSISPSGEILALAQMAGFQEQVPILRHCRLNAVQGEMDEQISPLMRYNCPIKSTAFYEPQKLLFAAEEGRVKSYQWGKPGGDDYEHGLPMHTLQSKKFDGPIHVLSGGGGKVICAGKGSLALWNIGSLKPHTSRRDDLVDANDIFDLEDDMDYSYWLSETSHRQPAAKSKPDQIVSYEKSTFQPIIWHPHPSQPGTMLSGANHQTKSYAFVGLDLEHGGKFSTRYLGHGGEVNGISTTPNDPHSFATACADGYVRMWDTRVCLPALSFNIEQGQDPATSVAFANPDGIPTLFTGGWSTQEIRLWDIRAQTAVYELSTGNNAVRCLSYDHSRNHLWAATEANAASLGYRQIQVPPGYHTSYAKRPKKAYHAENYFGEIHDAGRHMIYRYMFKENPDPGILPEMY